MKIIKFKKTNGNKYDVIFDDDLIIKLYDDVIIKFELLRKKEFTEKQFNEIVNYNETCDAYYKSIKYITKKLRTEKELSKYLSNYFSYEIISKTIKRLKEENYLDEKIYLKSYLNDQLLLNNIGPLKITNNLINLGLNDNDIKEAINNIDDQVWLDKLSKIIPKKIKSNHQYSSNKLKEKIIYDLSNNGYYKWMIEEVLKEYDLKNNDILEKEYNKLQQKLSKKYSGTELNYQIKIKLLSRGFNFEDIDNLSKDE